MTFKNFATSRPFQTLGLGIVAWLLVPLVVKSFVRASFFEFTAPITVTASVARDLREYWALRLHSNHELIEAGSDLARLNASYDVAVQANNELRSEVTRLEGLLKLPSFPNYRFEHARVDRRDLSGWWQRIEIRKGRNAGIPVDAPVIFTGGVVGRVEEVHATTAIVELLTSPGVRLSATIDGDDENRPVIYQGGINPTFGPPKGIVDIVPLDITANPRAPKHLITSGLGGVFPPGLSIGDITNVELASDGLFKTGDVKLDERLDSLTEVTVLVPVNPN